MKVTKKKASEVEVAIIGGGMGGLTTAVALNEAGIDAHLYEQAPAYGNVGGHLTIDEAAIEVLAKWSLDEPFNKIACKLDGMEVLKLGSGEVVTHFYHADLGSIGVKDEGRVGVRLPRAFLRSDYLDLLLERMPKGRVHVGHKLTGLKGDDKGATATFENGAEVRAKILLGADGVRSLAREMFDKSIATPANWTVLRTLCSADVLPENVPNDRMRFWDGWEFGDKANGVGVHVLIVPVRDNEFVSVDIQFEGGDQLEDCDPRDIPIERVLKRFPESMDPVVKRMIDERLEPITTHSIFDRSVAKKWVDQRIAILGDAAHSMRPNLGQGASQSIHDAGALADAFAEHGLTTKALEAYEALRKPYVAMIVDIAKKMPVSPKVEMKNGKAVQVL